MLFLVKVEIAEMPASELGSLLALIEQEWQAVMEMTESGQILACGKLADRPGAAAIFEVEDVEHLKRRLANLPLARHFQKVEVEPLIAAERAFRIARRRREAYERYRARTPERQAANRAV